MVDKGERHQISERVKANEAQKVRASKKIVSKEESVEQAAEATFSGNPKGSRRRKGKAA